MITEYWKDQLNTEERSCYDSIVNGLRKRQSRIECMNVDPQSFMRAYEVVSYDHPEFFYMSLQCQIGRTTSGLLFNLVSMTFMDVNPIYSPTEINECNASIAKAIREVKSKVTPNMTDREKVILAADYIVKNTKYEINHKFNQNAASALHFGRAQCSGISKAMKLLMDELGVYCLLVTGISRDNGVEGKHAWNIVRLDNKYYHLDITFMLGYNTIVGAPIKRGYLFYDDARISKNHEWDRSQVPECNDGSKFIDDYNIGAQRFNQANNSNYGNNGGAQRQSNVNHPHYSSLSEFRAELKNVLAQKGNKFECYVDIGINDMAALSRSVTNSVQMVLNGCRIKCSLNISIGAGLLVIINIAY